MGQRASSCVVPVPKRAPKPGCSFKTPPLDGSLTLPEIYDWHARRNASYPLFVFQDRAEGKLARLSFGQVVAAAHRAGRTVTKAVGVDVDDVSMSGGPVAILARTDSIAYVCVILGLLRAGITVVPIATSNSAEGVAHLVAETKATHVLVTSDQPTQALISSATASLNASNRIPPKTVPLPTYEELLTASAADKPLPKRKFGFSYPVIIVHSSGSSSLPKPIPWTHASLLQIATTSCFGTDLRGEVVGIQGSSMAHAGGLTHIPYLCASGYIAAVLPPGSPYVAPSPESVLTSYQECGCTFVKCVPSYLETWSHHEKDVDVLRGLKAVAYGGGPLRKSVGDFLSSKGVPVCSVYGMTEAGPIISRYFPEVLGEDWQYFCVNPQCNAKFVPAGPDTYELVIAKSATQELPIVNTQVDGVDAYATNDLIVKHPSKEGYWKVLGRADDQITLSNGLKTNPGPIESILNDDPHIRTALVFGRARTHVGVLVFLSDDTIKSGSRLHMRNLVWPAVERANQTVPRHSHIFKEMILIASPSKPLVLTEKGTIKRAATLAQYDADIDELYSNLDATALADIAAPGTWTPESALDYVRAVVQHVVPAVASDTQDLFDRGCTSLHALWIANAITRALGLSAHSVPLSFVYRHPTISGLGQFVFDLARGNAADEDGVIGRVQKMKQFAERFSYSPSEQRRSITPISDGGGKDVIIVTGTTGALGSSVLAHLVNLEQVAHVYAFNRRAEGGKKMVERQREALAKRRLDVEIATSPKVSLCDVDYETPGFGLHEELLEELRSTVTHVFHIAWPVNFNLALDAFSDALLGVKNLNDFVLSSHRPDAPRLIFASSIGIFKDNTLLTVAEEPVTDPSTSVGTGYSESKWVAEQIVESTRSWSNPLIVRIGQLAGGLGGNWDVHEWLPSLVRTSITVGQFPELRGPATWVPLDVAANALVESRNAPYGVLHLVHPRPVSLEFVAQTLAAELKLPLCSYTAWLEVLETEVSDADMAERDLPALRLLDFFRSVRQRWGEASGPTLLCEHAVDSSRALKEASPLSTADVQSWLAYWRGAGFV